MKRNLLELIVHKNHQSLVFLLFFLKLLVLFFFIIFSMEHQFGVCICIAFIVIVENRFNFLLVTYFPSQTCFRYAHYSYCGFHFQRYHRRICTYFVFRNQASDVVSYNVHRMLSVFRMFFYFVQYWFSFIFLLWVVTCFYGVSLIFSCRVQLRVDGKVLQLGTSLLVAIVYFLESYFKCAFVAQRI